MLMRGRAEMKWHGPPNPRVPPLSRRRSALSGPQTSRATFTLHCGLYIEVIEIETAQNPGRSGFSLVLYE